MKVYVVWQREYRAAGQNTEPMPELIAVCETGQMARVVERDAPTGYYRQIKLVEFIPANKRPSPHTEDAPGSSPAS
jgi:hypothetical protein